MHVILHKRNTSRMDSKYFTVVNQKVGVGSDDFSVRLARRTCLLRT